jgi:hypothetical protein
MLEVVPRGRVLEIEPGVDRAQLRSARRFLEREPTITRRRAANSSRVLSLSKRNSILDEKGSAACFKTA